MNAVTQFFAAVAALFGYKTKKLEVDNSPEMQARDRAQTDQQIKDGARTAIAQGDVDQLRKDLAE